MGHRVDLTGEGPPVQQQHVSAAFAVAHAIENYSSGRHRISAGEVDHQRIVVAGSAHGQPRYALQRHLQQLAPIEKHLELVTLAGKIEGVRPAVVGVGARVDGHCLAAVVPGQRCPTQDQPLLQLPDKQARKQIVAMTGPVAGGPFGGAASCPTDGSETPAAWPEFSNPIRGPHGATHRTEEPGRRHSQSSSRGETAVPPHPGPAVHGPWRLGHPRPGDAADFWKFAPQAQPWAIPSIFASRRDRFNHYLHRLSDFFAPRACGQAFRLARIAGPPQTAARAPECFSTVQNFSFPRSAWERGASTLRVAEAEPPVAQ